MVDTKPILKVGKNAEEGRAIPRGHAQVLGLEGKCQAQTFVGEILLEKSENTLPRRYVGESPKQLRTHQVRNTGIGSLEARKQDPQLGLVVVHETVEPPTFSRELTLHFLSHLHGVTAGIQALVSPTQAGHWIKEDQFQFIIKVSPGLSKHFVEGKPLMEECWARVKRIGPRTKLRIPSTNAVRFLHHRDSETPVGENHCRGQASWAGAHDDNVS